MLIGEGIGVRCTHHWLLLSVRALGPADGRWFELEEQGPAAAAVDGHKDSYCGSSAHASVFCWGVSSRARSQSLRCLNTASFLHSLVFKTSVISSLSVLILFFSLLEEHLVILVCTPYLWLVFRSQYFQELYFFFFLFDWWRTSSCD